MYMRALRASVLGSVRRDQSEAIESKSKVGALMEQAAQG